jgi:hypothetical protein
MIPFKHFLLERSGKRTVAFHLTKSENLRTILKEGLIPNKKSRWDGFYKSYQGIYFSKDLQNLIRQYTDDWDMLGKDQSYGLVVIESLGFTQMFNDEDHIVDCLPTIGPNIKKEVFENYIQGDLNKEMVIRTLIKFINNIKKRFSLNSHQEKLMISIIDKNTLPIFFRGIEKLSSPEYVDIFKKRYNITNTDDHFRSIMDKLSNLKMVYKNSEREQADHLDSFRIKTNIGFSGNPKIIGLFEIHSNGNIDCIYSKMNPLEQNNILEIVQGRLE